MLSEERSSIKEFFSKKETLFILLVIIAGLLLRWIDLDLRALHHDESLHAIYGKYFYTDPEEKFYRYDPLLHGPVLYNLLPYFYQVLDITKFAGRSMIALIGTFFMFVPFLFRRYLTKNTLLLLVTFIALSPSLIYWSRFLREDFLVLLSMFLMLWGATIPPARFRPLFFFAGLSLHFCIKENSYVTLALLLGFLFFEIFFKTFISKDTTPSLLKNFFQTLNENRLYSLLGFLFSAFVFCYFFSSGFRYADGILDGLYRKGFIYWLSQHNMDRIKGPFIFHFLNLAWYEFIFILGTLAVSFHFYLKTSWRYRLPIILSFGLATALHLIYRRDILELHQIFSVLKIKINLDFYLFIFLIVHSLLVTIKHLFDRERALAFWGYFFFATFFAYSFVGEKVPWLSLYPFTAGIIYLALYLQKHSILESFSKIQLSRTGLSLKHLFFAILILFNLRMALMTNFGRAGDETEFISQVHTTKVYETLMHEIQKEILFPTRGPPPKILVLNDAIWPTTWYFFGLDGFSFAPPADKNYLYYDYIVANSENTEIEEAVKESHERQLIPLRSWWVPDYERMNALNFLNYAVNHNPWNSPGQFQIAYYTRKK